MGIFQHGVEDERMLTTIEGGCLLEYEGYHQLDIVDHNGLSMELCSLRILILDNLFIGFLRTSSVFPSLSGACYGSSDRLFGCPLEFLDGWRHGDEGRRDVDQASAAVIYSYR